MVHTRHSFLKDEEEHLKVNGDIGSEESQEISNDKRSRSSVQKPAAGETDNDKEKEIVENSENEEKEKEPTKDQVHIYVYNIYRSTYIFI